MFLAGCGRVGFDSEGAFATGTISWVQVFVAHGQLTSSASDTFTAAAREAGDAIVIHTYCTTNTPPTAVALAAPGWTFTQVGPFSGSAANTDWAATFGAFAPDTASATFTVTWAGTPRCKFQDELGDELAGAAAFDAHDEAYGANGNCAGALTTGAAGEAVWAACSGNVSGTGAGYTKSADDTNNDWTEYRLTDDPAGTVQQVSFTNTTTSWAMTAVSLTPR